MISNFNFRYIYFSFLVFIFCNGFEYIDESIQTVGKDTTTLLLYLLAFYGFGAFINVFAYILFEILPLNIFMLSKKYSKKNLKLLRKKKLYKVEFIRDFILTTVIMIPCYLTDYNILIALFVLLIPIGIYLFNTYEIEKIEDKSEKESKEKE